MPERSQQQDIDARVRGQGCYVDDVPLPGALHLAFARSPVAVGRILEVDLALARDVPGVVALHAGDAVAHLGDLSVNPVLPLPEVPRFEALAGAQVSAVGQPVIAVLADSATAAADASALIGIDVDARDVMPEPRMLASHGYAQGDCDAAFAQAAHVVGCTLVHPRLAPCALEPRGIAVRYHPETDSVTLWQSTQTPHRTRRELARILGIAPERLRVIAPDVGGAFGMKASLYPEEVVAVWAAFHHRRSVKWIASRSDEFLSATHGRGLRGKGRLALDAEGRFLALEARIEAPLGQWLPNSALVPAWNAARILPSGYDIDCLDIRTTALSEHRAPMGIYRGAGRPEANALMERLVDKAARATGLDPVEIRQRNLLPPERLPHRTGTGSVLDSGCYGAALTALAADHDRLRARRDSRRAAGGLFGIGLAFFVEPSGEGWESARVTLLPGGRVDVDSGSSCQGHSRKSALARIASAALGVPETMVNVRLGDTQTCPEGIGALASRSTAIGGSAVQSACLEVAARQAAGEALPITAELRYDNDGQAWGYGAYLVGVTIDRDTGEMEIDSVHCIDDAGTVIQPAQVAGQIQGGFAQGLGEAMMEALHYDDMNQLLTGSLMDYALPRATDVPTLVHGSLCTPSPMNLLGAKGVGEAGTIGAPIAILNAALDALAPLGVTDLQMPLTPLTLWNAINAATQDRTA